MPKKRNLDLAAELGEEVDVTEEQANDANQIVPAPAPTPVAAPPANMSLSVADIQAIVATAITASQQGNANLADIVTQGIAQARKPIPEGTDASNPRISAANPLGDRDHPRPLLKCEMYLGTQDAKTSQVSRTYPYNHEDLTVHEIIAFNTLEPGHYKGTLYDGMEIKISVVPEYDGASDALRRLVIVVPGIVTGKGSALKNSLRRPCDLVSEITGGPNYERLSKDDLAWFMAEHRAGRYVSKRELVAA
jgi:hypothetical protein